VRALESLPLEGSLSQITEISVGEVGVSEHQDISSIHHELQVAFTRAEASTFTTVSRGRTEHVSSRLSHSQIQTEQTITEGREVMTVTTTEHPYIVRDPRIGEGEPIIVGTAVRVRILVEYWREGTSPEELIEAFPHLTLAQVFDALSYYQDHQPEINALIEQHRVDPSLFHESVRQPS
jgi:uncharacterized protein (DUF433 family)